MPSLTGKVKLSNLAIQIVSTATHGIHVKSIQLQEVTNILNTKMMKYRI